ncbi:hypothetical protein B7494_g1246 [Chlorociboria aeruginascens]|nr:hypothetical protein B7494_g1246 [Chlorociboria aeruginascens]
MISATRRWLKRNRTPFAIGLGAIGVGYIATKYVLGKISDARERMSSDRIARENLRRRFEQNQEDCTFTVLALLPTATDNILAELETERITFELQQQKAAKLARNGEAHPSEMGSSPPSVTDDDSRSMASASLQSESGVHASQMSIPSTAVVREGPQDGGQQLNLLGRRSYLSSVVSLATGGMDQSTISLENHDDDNENQVHGDDFETNRRYLTLSWWLLHRGWREVMLKVETTVKDVFDTLRPRDDVSMQRFSELTIEVRKRVEGATESDRQASRWLQYLLPPQDRENFVLKESGMSEEPSAESPSISSSGITPLRRLIDETSDLIDSPPFAHVLTLLLDAGFSTLVDQKIAQQAFKMPPTSGVLDSNVPRVTELFDAKLVKLPIVLAILSKQAHSIGNGVPNEYLQAMEQVRDLEAFAAVVYSSNWGNEISPTSEDASTKFKKEGPEGPEIVVSDARSEVGAEHESLIDVGTTSTFESAWGNAVGTVDKSSE